MSEAAHHRLVAELRARGDLDADWEEVFRAVPRHRFIAGTVYVDGEPVDRETDPERWWRVVHADDTVVTQLNDGGDGSWPMPTSSSSAPGLVARMLRALDLADGHTVLEIGTGTGWNAALLCRRLGGAGQVTTVEIDPDLAAAAARRLRAAGHRAQVVIGDGEAGHPPGAPYDRVIATCAVSRVPLPWIEQTRPGGLVLLPWSPVAQHGGAWLVALRVAEDGTATGRFGEATAFMSSRRQRGGHPLPPGMGRSPESVADTGVDPQALLLDPRTAFPVLLRVPAVHYGLRTTPDGRLGVWIAADDASSWAWLPPDGDRWRVEQAGPRRLWDEVDAARRWWHGAGEPPPGHFGLTVGPAGRYTWYRPPGRA